MDRDQLARLKSNASLKGFKTLSAYLRDATLNEDVPINKVLSKLHHIEQLINDKKNGKR